MKDARNFIEKVILIVLKWRLDYEKVYKKNICIFMHADDADYAGSFHGISRRVG